LLFSEVTRFPRVNVSVKPAKPVITRPQPVNSIITGTNGTPLNVTCLSVGGYPQQTVSWYKNRTGENPTKLSNCDSMVENQTLYNVTETCTLTPTKDDKGAKLYCQSSYTGQPTLLEKSDEVQLQLLCKLYKMLLSCELYKLLICVIVNFSTSVFFKTYRKSTLWCSPKSLLT